MSTENQTLTLTFGQAMDIVTSTGQPVACEYWHGEEQLSANSNTNRVAEADLWNPLNKEVARRNGGYANNLPYFTKVVGENIQMGWQPTQEEMFAKWQLANVRHFLDSVTLTDNQEEDAEDLELHFYPMNSKELPTVLPYWMLYDQGMVKEGEHVVFASKDMRTNIINCLIYDAMVAAYSMRILNSVHDGFVIRDKELADGTWKNYLNQRSSAYVLVLIEEDESLAELIEALEYSSILVADAKTVNADQILEAHRLATVDIAEGADLTFALIDLDEQIGYSVQAQDFSE